MPTPASNGFVMPAEWERHSCTWMAWPCREEVWGEHLEAAQAAYADVAKAIADFEPVSMICRPEDVAEASLACGNGVEILPMPIDDSWVRDSGPTFVVDRKGRLAGVDWQFNAWGEKYLPYDQDAQVARRILEHVGVERYEAPFVLEGGAIHVDGEGTVLVTEECLLNPNRNPGMTRERMEEYLRAYLGVEKVIWLARGLQDDETDGHIDEVACFARPGVVLMMTTADKTDGNYDVMQENLERLRAETDAKGRPLEIVELPQPARRDYPDGRRITLSYANFYMPNGGIIMPAFDAAFDAAEDRAAFRIMRDTFPDRTVIQIPASEIVWGGGGIHCITQQQPAV